MIIDKYPKMTLEDLRKTTWDVDDPHVLGEYEGRSVAAFRFMVVDTDVDFRVVSRVNLAGGWAEVVEYLELPGVSPEGNPDGKGFKPKLDKSGNPITKRVLFKGAVELYCPQGYTICKVSM